METISKTKDEIIKTTTKEEVFIIKDLEAELEEIEKQIIETEKQPDEILTPNLEKIEILKHLEQEKIRINEILK